MTKENEIVNEKNNIEEPLVYDFTTEFGTSGAIGRTPEQDLYEGRITQQQYDNCIRKF